MIRSRRSAGIAAAALVVTIIAAGCARGPGNIATGCADGQGDAVPAVPAATAPSATGAPAPPAQQDTERAVCAAFDTYRRALLDRDAPAALAVVSDGTIEYYDSLARLAGTGGPEEIGARSLVDRITIAVLRTQYSTADLAGMDGRQLFGENVEAGRVDSSTLADAELGTVRIEGERAYAQIVADGTPTPVDFEFVYADGTWHFDVVSAHQVTNSALQHVTQQTGVSEDELIFEAVESATGQRIDESIFDRP